jgi:hypothetical protein
MLATDGTNLLFSSEITAGLSSSPHGRTKQQHHRCLLVIRWTGRLVNHSMIYSSGLLIFRDLKKQPASIRSFGTYMHSHAVNSIPTDPCLILVLMELLCHRRCRKQRAFFIPVMVWTEALLLEFLQVAFFPREKNWKLVVLQVKYVLGTAQ